MTAGLGSGEETITAATHGLALSLVYTCRKKTKKTRTGEQCISIDLSTDTVSQESGPVSAVL